MKENKRIFNLQEYTMPKLFNFEFGEYGLRAYKKEGLKIANTQLSNKTNHDECSQDVWAKIGMSISCGTSLKK